MRYKVGLSQRNQNKYTIQRPSGLYFAKSRVTGRRVSPTPTITNGKTKKVIAGGFRKTLSKIFVILFGIGVFFFAIGVVVASIYLKKLEAALPDPNKLIERDSKLSTQIFDRNGVLLYTFYGDQNREFVKLDDLPKHLIWAVLSAEDIGFYEHKGVDLTGLTRAVLQKLGLMSGYSGASTITQQLVKKTLQSDFAGSELDSLNELEKLQQILLALQVEQKFTKDEILQLYMNEIFLGGVNYGFQSASKAYFGKDVRQLDLAESALLAGLIQAPGAYAPIGGTNPELAIVRQKYVLEQMLKHKELTGVTQEDVDKALGEKLVFKSANIDIKAPHFVFYVKKELDDLYGPDKVIQGGLKVTTTLDYSMQKIAENEIKTGIAKYGKKYNVNNGALVAIDPKTGDILSMVGSIDYNNKNKKIDGNVNVTVSLRQMGSSVKPFTYLTAFNQGYGPWLETPDIMLNFGNYKLVNWDKKYFGPMVARQALIQSRNLPAVYTMQLIGIDNFLKTAKTLGITTLTDTSNYGLSLTLGAGEMKLLEHAGAYTVFATGGIKRDIRSILEVKDSNGKVLLARSENKGKRVWDEKEIYMLNWILCDLGGFGDQPSNQYYFMNGRRTFCGKTGTTDGPKDLTSMYYSKSLVVGVWAGNNDNTETPGAWSTTVPLPIAQSFMLKVVNKYKPEAFNRPAGIIAGLVCNDTGELAKNDTPCKKVPTIYISDKSPKTDERELLYICKDTNLLSTNVEFSKANNLVYTQTLLKKKLENTQQQVSYENFMTKSKSYTFNKPAEGECKIPVGDGGAPTILLATPSNNETVVANTSIYISAYANSSLPITKVEFLFDGGLIGTKTTAPYAISYTIPLGTTPGLHSITAIVYDSDGRTASSVINVNVVTGAFSVNLLTPTAGSLQTLPVNLSAVTIGGGIDRVEFILSGPDGFSDILTDTNGGDGWSVVFNNTSIKNGTHDYSLVAKAYKGISTATSGTVTFKISK